MTVTGDVIEVDENITIEKILWNASVRIEKEQLITTGGFNAEDFLISYADQTINASLSSGQKVIRIVKASSKERLKREGMTLDIESDIRQPLLRDNPRKIPIEVINGINVDNIEVYAVALGGYGTYRDIYTINTASAKTDNAGQQNKNIVSLNNIDFNNYPQPFSDETNIEFSVSETQNVLIEVFNIDGKLVKVLFDGVVNREEKYIVNFHATTLSRGLYICKFKSKEKVITRKLLSIR